jgi:hypothetical protein
MSKRYIVSAASDPAVASHASADRLCKRDRRFLITINFHNLTTNLNNFMSRTPKRTPNELKRVKLGYVELT